MESAKFILGQTTLTGLTKKMEADQIEVMPVKIVAGETEIGSFVIKVKKDNKFIVEDVIPAELKSLFESADNTTW